MVTGPLKPLEPEDVADLKLPEECLTFGAIAAHLGMSRATLERRRKENAEVDAAVKAILRQQREKLEKTTTGLLLRKAKGGDLGAMIWLEKSRLGYSDRVTQIQEGDLNIRINRGVIPDPTPPDENA